MSTLREWLEQAPWCERFDALDRQFALMIAGLCRDKEADHVDHLGLAAAWLSAAVREGHVCLAITELEGLAAKKKGDPSPPGSLPDLEAWRKLLRASRLVGSSGRQDCPLIFDADRLYLQRLFQAQEDLIDALRSRSAGQTPPPAPAQLAADLDECFPPVGSGSDAQRQAGLALLTRKLLLLTGGPGTGKTWTIARALRLICRQTGSFPPIRLAAPTGKAAARLTEAMREATADLGLELPPATTIHRLLGPRRHSPDFRHDRRNPLPEALYVIDELSMFDLPLAARFVRALPSAARLALVGDPDQLASVEAGAVLAELVRAAREAESPLASSWVQLTRSHRFAADRGIGRVAAAVRSGEGPAALAALQDTADPDTVWRETPAEDRLAAALVPVVEEAFARLYRLPDVAERLAALQHYRILAGLRGGPWGVERLNRLVESLLQEQGLIRRDDEFYPGRPLMVTANDYHLGLFNGDVGMVGLNASGERRVYFPSGPSALREVLPLLLPAAETVFAMTVHKSQGSEFDRVLLVLPPEPHALLTRELVYTALTRARRRCEIWGRADAFVATLARSVVRHSGLAERLAARRNLDE